MKQRPSETGSVLFYILIGIVLFAALSFAVSRIMSGGGENPRTEITRLQASEILQYARTLSTAVQTLRVGGAATDTQISFDNQLLSGYTNASCGGLTACSVFSVDNGVSYATPSAEWLDNAQSAGAHFGTWLFSGNNIMTGVGTDGNAAASADLMAILPWVRHDLCITINDMLHIANPGGDPPPLGTDADLTDTFTGVYTDTQTITGAGISGLRMGCFQGHGAGTPPSGTYHFFAVLLAR